MLSISGMERGGAWRGGRDVCMHGGEGRGVPLEDGSLHRLARGRAVLDDVRVLMKMLVSDPRLPSFEAGSRRGAEPAHSRHLNPAHGSARKGNKARSRDGGVVGVQSSAAEANAGDETSGAMQRLLTLIKVLELMTDEELNHPEPAHLLTTSSPPKPRPPEPKHPAFPFAPA